MWVTDKQRVPPMPPEQPPRSPSYGAAPSPSTKPFDAKRAQAVRDHVAKYAKPNDLEALFHVIVVLAVWFGCWALPWWCAPLHSLVAVRLFVLCVHDTGHRSAFSAEWMNRLVGTLVAPLTSFCYTYWAEGHDYHHYHSNDLNFEQWSQTAPITVKEFKSYSPLRRAMFRFFSVPLALVAAGGPLSIVVLQPLMSDYTRAAGVLDWAAQFAWWGALWYTGSFARYLLVIVPIGFLGLFLFHAQHTWAETKRYAGLTVKNKGTPEEGVNHDGLFLNAIEGSSLLYVPEWMKWFTARIEYHRASGGGGKGAQAPAPLRKPFPYPLPPPSPPLPTQTSTTSTQGCPATSCASAMRRASGWGCGPTSPGPSSGWAGAKRGATLSTACSMRSGAAS